MQILGLHPNPLIQMRGWDAAIWGLTSFLRDSDAYASLRIPSSSLKNRSPVSQGDALVRVSKAPATELRFVMLFLMVLSLFCHILPVSCLWENQQDLESFL